MASGDLPPSALAPMRAYEQKVWPEVEQLERRFRRADRLFVACFLIGTFVLVAGTGTLPQGWQQGVLVGLVAPLSFYCGICWQRILSRRSGFRELQALHEQAQFTLSYHHEGGEDG